MTKRTSDCKKLRNTFGIISYLIWLGCAIFAIVSVFCFISKSGNKELAEEAGKIIDEKGAELFSEDFKKLLVGIAVTGVILIIISIFMSNKMRLTVWLMSMIVSTLVYGRVGMFVIAGIWLIDEYLFYGLFHYYKNLFIINRENDLREE